MVDRSRFLTSLVLAPLLLTPAVGAASFAITDVQLFDGERTLQSATVLVEDGRVRAVGGEIVVPDGFRVISRPDATLIPGLIDSHTHSFDGTLERAATWGVTTVIDMFTAPSFAAERRAEQLAGGVDDRADLVSAGVLATAPGGHGTQYGMQIATLDGPSDADAWVRDRAAEGSDFIKIVIEDGSVIGRPLPTLSPATVAALVEAAHARGLLAVAHATTLSAAQTAVEAGVDGLVHLFGDVEAPAGFVDQLTERGVFVVPTLTVVESLSGRASGAGLIDDDRLASRLTAAERGGLTRSFPAGDEAPFDNATLTAGRLRSAGVSVLAGTDAPNPGTAHGVSMHRELELLVAAGWTPREALSAATARPAAAFRLDDRGRIAPGLRADLLLVAGDPLEDITALRAIDTVWKGGVEIARPTPKLTPTSTVATVEGAIADFETGELTATAGYGWTGSTDSLMGGASTVELTVVDGGVGDSDHALAVSGEVQAGFAFPWAGAMYFPGAAPMTPADLSEASLLVFRVRGTPGTYRMMIFAESLGTMPSQLPFEVTEEWRETTLALTDFPGVDSSGITGILWTAGPSPGTFRIELDDIELRVGDR